jgi:hypothetical protein
MITIATSSPAGRALDMLADLQKQGRMSRAEAQTVLDLVRHPDFPNSLRKAASEKASLKKTAATAPSKTRPKKAPK